MVRIFSALMVTILLFVSLISISCTKSTTFIPSDKTAPEAPATSSDLTWEQNWEETLNAARKERKVVIYTASKGPALKEAAPVVKRKFGLDLDIITRRGKL